MACGAWRNEIVQVMIWNKYPENLPEKSGHYLACCEEWDMNYRPPKKRKPEIRFGFFNSEHNVFHAGLAGFSKVRYWMNIPEIPTDMD